MNRIVEAVNFETDEALLTGESLPVRKDPEMVCEEDTGPGDRLNVAYSSSTVTKGRARGVVFATGLHTEIGSIAAALRASGSRVRPVKRNEKGKAGPHRYAQAWTLTTTDAVGRFLGVNVGTPLQKKLSRLAVLLFFIAVICAIIVLAANDFSNEQEVIIYAVATGLSMIPASLIVVLTITMAAGTKTMVERHVIVRNLKSLEALGAVTDICSDKTGTLTQGKMICKKAWIPACGTYSVDSSTEPFNPTSGDLRFADASQRSNSTAQGDSIPYDELLKDNEHLPRFLDVAALANLSTVYQDKEGKWVGRGDPTETAINVFAHRFKWNRTEMTAWKTILEFPFDSDVKKMSVLMENHETGKRHIFTKGAVERVIQTCSRYYPRDGSGEAADVTEEVRSGILEQMEEFASLGLRVLALASRDAPGDIDTEKEVDRNTIETELTFRGLVGLYDPPRAESAGAVKECRHAGIDVHMLTGDHPGTAKAIAIEVGILPSRRELANLPKDVADSMVMAAHEFDKLSDDEIDQLPTLPLVVARCAPNTKVRMIEALHRRKKFAAMVSYPSCLQE